MLSIIIPSYNEEATIYNILEKVSAVYLIENLGKEFIIVDDGSIDNTVKEVNRFKANFPNTNLNLILKGKNSGKGHSIHQGISAATGDYIIIQDADLEYDPKEYNKLLQPIIDGFADVVFGSRFKGGDAHRVLFFWHTIGNKFLTFLSNVFTGLNLSDMETCYKLFKSDIIKSVNLKEKKFGFEPEVTAKISNISRIRIYEVGISYYGRTYSEGKKIGWKDGFRAIYCIVYYNLFR